MIKTQKPESWLQFLGTYQSVTLYRSFTSPVAPSLDPKAYEKLSLLALTKSPLANDAAPYAPVVLRRQGRSNEP